MKSLVLVAKNRLALKDVAIPRHAPDECLIKVAAAGICSSDLLRVYRGGAYAYPLVMGHEFSGTVERCGRRVKGFKPGDPVAVMPLIPCQMCPYCRARDYHLCTAYDYYGSRRNGGFSSYIAIKAWNLLKLPPTLDLRAAAVIEPSAVAWHAAQTLKASRRDTVVVLGAGFIGLMVVQFLTRVLKCSTLYVVDRNPFKLRLARRFGAVPVDASNSRALQAFLKKHGNRFSRVVETCGAPDTFRWSLHLAARQAQVVWVGNPSDDVNLPKELVSRFLRKELRLSGIWNSRLGGHPDSDWQAVVRLLNKRVVRVEPLIRHRVALKDSVDAFRRLNPSTKHRRREHFFKVLLIP